MSEATIYNWKVKYGGLEVSEAKRLRSLEDEDENAKLKRLLADAMLDNATLTLDNHRRILNHVPIRCATNFFNSLLAMMGPLSRNQKPDIKCPAFTSIPVPASRVNQRTTSCAARSILAKLARRLALARGRP